MKKILLSVLAVALTIVACNRYDDDFDALNQKLQDLEQKINTLEELRSQVTNLQTNVGALQGALAGVGSQVSGLTAFSNSVTSILGDISDLQAALDAASSDEEVAALKAELATTLDELSALVEANGAQLAQVLILVQDNNDALESVVASLAAVTTDLSSIKGSLVTMTATMESNKTAIIAALTEVMTADKTAILNAIGASEDALAATMATNQAALVEAIADNKASTLAAVSSALADILESNEEGFASTVGSLTLSVSNALEDILEGQSTTEASLQSYISTVGASNLAAITTAISDAVSSLEDGQAGVLADVLEALTATQTALEADLDSLADGQLDITAAVNASEADIITSIASALTDILAGQSSQTAALTTVMEDEVATVITTLGTISGSLTDLSDALAAHDESIDGQLTALSTLISDNQTALLATLSTLATSTQATNILAAVQAVLDLQVTYTGDLYITNAAELEFAQALGTKVRILKGDVYIDVSDDSGLTAEQVSTVTSLMQAIVASGSDPGSNNAEGDVARVSVVVNSGTVDMSALRNIAGDLTISATGTGSVNLGALVEVAGQASIGTEASIDMSSLVRVTGDYYVSGHDIDDQALTTVGLSSSSANVNLNYEGGYVQPNLATVYGGLYIVDYAAAAADDAEGNGTTSVDFRGLESVSNFATITSEDADAHHSGGGSSAGTSASTTNAPTGGTAYTLVLRSATSVIFGEAAVVSITANEATSIDHNYSGSLDSLDITANSATTVNVSASDVTGATTIDSGADTTVSVTSDLADVTITDGLTVTLSGDISGTATMNPAATASVTLSGSTVNDLDVNSGATYDIDANLTTVDFVDAGSSVDITGDISGAANFALTSGDLTINGNLAGVVNVTDETADTVSITGNITGAAAFALADDGELSITGNLGSTIDVTGGNAASASIEGDVTGAASFALGTDSELSITGALTSDLNVTGDKTSSVEVTGIIGGDVSIDPLADATITFGDNIGGSLDITGTPSSVTLGGHVIDAADVALGAEGVFTSASGFDSSLTIVGGLTINMNGTDGADGPVDITLSDDVDYAGTINIYNDLNSTLDIIGGTTIQYFGSSITGAVVVDMKDSGAFVATALESFGGSVSIDAEQLTLTSLGTMNGGLATFANATSLSLPSLTSASTGIVANSATTITMPALVSASPITATSAVTFNAVNYKVAASLTLGSDASVRVDDVQVTAGDFTGVLASASTLGALYITNQSDSFSTTGLIGMHTFDVTSGTTGLSVTVSDDNANLGNTANSGSLTIRGDWNAISVGDGSVLAGGLDSLTTFTTAVGSTAASVTVTNTAALESVNFNHAESSPDGIAVSITDNQALESFTTSADRAYSFIVTGNDVLTEFDASSYTNIPADTDSDAPGDKVEFVFTIGDNALFTGTKQANDATFEQEFQQASLATIRDFIVAAFAGVAADAAISQAASELSTISVSLSYKVGNSDVGADDDDGPINDLDEVQAIVAQ
jgi:predicted  nucleic acid-binding Zn-ribbon protein